MRITAEQNIAEQLAIRCVDGTQQDHRWITGDGPGDGISRRGIEYPFGAHAGEGVGFGGSHGTVSGRGFGNGYGVDFKPWGKGESYDDNVNR